MNQRFSQLNVVTSAKVGRCGVARLGKLYTYQAGMVR